MAFTVDSAFDEFYKNINLSGDHRSTANDRKDHLIELLSEKFEVLDAFGTGSIPRFTALKAHADVDIMVALHFSKHVKGKSPSQLLQDVRDAIAFKTNVRKNGQAVTLYYDTWPDVDVVPVSRTLNNDGSISHYNVPNANTGTWIRSRPMTHSRNIEAKSTECGENFRRIIKMTKWWSINRGDILQSFHIEVLAFMTMTGNADDTPWHVVQFFSKAQPLLRGALWHDGGQVDEYLGNYERQDILKKFEAASARAKLAWHSTYGSNSDHRTAIAHWKVIFGEKFPAYG